MCQFVGAAFTLCHKAILKTHLHVLVLSLSVLYLWLHLVCVAAPPAPQQFPVIERTEAVVGNMRSAVQQQVNETTTAARQAVQSRVAAVKETVQLQMSAVQGAVQSRVTAVQGAVQQQVNETATAARQAVQTRMSAAQGAVQSRVNEAKAAVQERTAAVRGAVQQRVSAFSGGLQGGGRRLLGDDETDSKSASDVKPEDKSTADTAGAKQGDKEEKEVGYSGGVKAMYRVRVCLLRLCALHCRLVPRMQYLRLLCSSQPVALPAGPAL